MSGRPAAATIFYRPNPLPARFHSYEKATSSRCMQCSLMCIAVELIIEESMHL